MALKVQVRITILVNKLGSVLTRGCHSQFSDFVDPVYLFLELCDLSLPFDFYLNLDLGLQQRRQTLGFCVQESAFRSSLFVEKQVDLDFRQVLDEKPMDNGQRVVSSFSSEMKRGQVRDPIGSTLGFSPKTALSGLPLACTQNKKGT